MRRSWRWHSTASTKDASGSWTWMAPPVAPPRSGPAASRCRAVRPASTSRRAPARSDVSRTEADRRLGRVGLYSPLVADLPIELAPALSERLARALDVEGKLTRALDDLGPIKGRDVILVDGSGGLRARQLTGLGARVTLVDSNGPARFDAPG